MKAIALGCILAAMLLASGTARAQDTNWTGTSQAWENPAFWDNGVPNATKNAIIDNGGKARASAASVAALSLTVGIDNFGQVVMDAHQATVGDLLLLGQNSLGQGTFDLGAGYPCVLNTQYVVVGDAGGGTFNQDAGQHVVASALLLGNQELSSGTYKLAGGSLTANGDVAVGEAGTGIFDQEQANVSIASSLILGDQVTANGTYRLHSGSLHAQGISVGSGGLGMFIQYDGNVQVDNTIAIGEWATGNGSYSIQAGTLTAKRIQVGVAGTGSLDLAAAAAAVTVTDKLTLGSQASLTASTPVTVKLNGDLVIAAYNTGDLSGLGNVDLVLQGGAAKACKVTAAGVDYGAVTAGWVNNRALHSLTLGGDQSGRLLVVDDPTVADALYVETLTINAGGSVDSGGVLYYLNGGGPKRFFSGDANLDGGVDVVDLGVLARNYDQSNQTWASGDFNGDGAVDVVDLGILARNYDSYTVVPGGSVPEPATLALLLSGGAAMLRRRETR